MINKSLHPITVIIIFFALLLPSIIFSNPIIIFTLLIIVNIIIIAFGGKDKLKYILPIFLLYFFISLAVNFIFTNAGTTVIFQINQLPIIGGYKRLSLELILFTLTGSFRLLYIFSIFNILSIISDGDRLMTFFSKFLKKFPLLLSFSIRLIPKLTSDYRKLEHIFKLKGFNKSNHKKKITKLKDKNSLVKKIKETLNPKLMIVLIRTLLMNSLEDSLEFAESMQSRGFGDIKKRSTFSKDFILIVDYIIISISIFYITFTFILKSYSIGAKDIYPLFKLSNFINIGELISIIIIIILNIIIFILCYLVIKTNSKLK